MFYKIITKLHNVVFLEGIINFCIYFIYIAPPRSHSLNTRRQSFLAFKKNMHKVQSTTHHTHLTDPTGVRFHVSSRSRWSQDFLLPFSTHIIVTFRVFGECAKKMRKKVYIHRHITTRRKTFNIVYRGKCRHNFSGITRAEHLEVLLSWLVRASSRSKIKIGCVK